jgi:hypothetical protein
MNTISESATQWRPNAQPALAVSGAPNGDIPKSGDVDENDGFKIFGNDGFTFLDLVDIVNPLQHIPVIGTLYREMTGDSLDPGSRVIGGTLFLGPFGTVSALANVLVDDATGKDMGEHVLAFLEDPEPARPEVAGTDAKPVAIAAAPIAVPAAVSSYSAFSTARAPADGAGAVEAIDLVTAWAMAETSYRQSAGGKPSARDSNPNTQHASMPETASIAAWARAEVSYRKAAAKATPTRAQRAKPVVVQAPAAAQVSTRQASSTRDALAALRKDLLAGGQRTTARAANAVPDTRQKTASFAAASYARRQPAPAGAIASEGGWFTETMLSALNKRDKDAKPARPDVIGAARPAIADPAR